MKLVVSTYQVYVDGLYTSVRNAHFVWIYAPLHPSQEHWKTIVIVFESVDGVCVRGGGGG